MTLKYYLKGAQRSITQTAIFLNPRLLIVAVSISLGLYQDLWAQVPQGVRWFRVGELRSWYSSYGCEMEIGRTGQATEQNDGLIWPAEWKYQNNVAGKGMWLGTTNYYDRTLQTTVPYKVVAVGTRTTDPVNEIMPVSFKMYGRFLSPNVVVDGLTATDNALNDEVDEVDPTLKPDRMIVNELNTYIGITIRRKLMAFSQQDHDNYFIYDYVLKNTGIVNNNGTIENKTLTGVVLFFETRYAFGNESFKNNWFPSNNIDWGRNAMDQVIGTDPTASGFDLRAEYSWYGKHSQSSLPDDIGLPYYYGGQGDGHFGGVQYAGTVTIHADKSSSDASDDPYQPKTTMYMGSDGGPQTNNQFDPVQMGRKYTAMTVGHAIQTQADAVGSGFANSWGSDAGGYAQTKAYGPYTLAPGDSVHIVMADGVSGLHRDSAYSLGKQWLNGHLGTQSTFKLPNGSTTTDPDVFKDAWIKTGEDSLLQTFRRARSNFNSGYQIPLPPPPPGLFEVKSGGDRIRLTWSAVAWPNLVGYDVYRATGRPDTFYTNIYSCNSSVTTYDDVSAFRGRDYYYYVVSRDDGSTHGGVPLVSSKFYTMTNKPAFLRRPAKLTTMDSIRVVPNPYNHSAAIAGMYFTSNPDRIAFYGLPPVCTIKLYTERGDLINTLTHNDGSGDQLWDSRTSSEQIIVSGLYIAVFQTPDGETAIRKFVVIR
jgi:hypothetical protein